MVDKLWAPPPREKSSSGRMEENMRHVFHAWTDTWPTWAVNSYDVSSYVNTWCMGTRLCMFSSFPVRR